VVPRFPFFKETEQNNRCCGCNGTNNNNSQIISTAPNEYTQIVGVRKAYLNNNPTTEILDTVNTRYKVQSTFKNDMFTTPQPTGPSHYTGQSFPHSQALQAQKNTLNLNLAHNHHKRHRKN
jgi:hypothetical protein